MPLSVSGNFNSRPSARGDGTGGMGNELRISIHAPPRGATSRNSVAASFAIFQFTPLREGRPGCLHEKTPRLTISIHAPPRGATERTDEDGKRQKFQFTPLREGRLLCPVISRAEYISIHAPPRGATLAPVIRQSALSISIHAPPRGATAKDMQFLQIFCSTLTNQHGLTIMPRNLSRLFW